MSQCQCCSNEIESADEFCHSCGELCCTSCLNGEKCPSCKNVDHKTDKKKMVLFNFIIACLLFGAAADSLGDLAMIIIGVLLTLTGMDKRG